jgi:hypothetical protein
MRLQPTETIPFPADFRVREMLAHDVYDVPLPDREDQVTCSWCGVTGTSLEDVPHKCWCLYPAVRPEVPS